jgi:signal peptidase I
MLHELERDELSAVTVRGELIKAAAEKMATGGGDLVLAELCAWAWQNRDWSTLEQVWLVHGFAALLGNPAIAGWFAQTPPDARRDHPALSLPYATIAGLRDSTSPDLDRMIRALVQEGRLHSGWSRHENLDDAIRAGTLWMTSVGAFPAGTQGRPNEDAWRISQAIEDGLVQEAESGSFPSTAAEASFRGFSALVAISTGDVVVVVPTRPDRDVHVGDVVTFQPVSGDPTLVTHRVVAKSITANGVLFTTKGDANRADDQPIRSEQVVGKFFVRVPLVGYLTVWLGQYRTLVTSAIGLCLLGYALASVLVWIRTRPRRKAAA